MSQRTRPRNGAPGGKYRIPRGLDYNEFVGELGPPDGRNHAELHIRYGKRDDGLYADWSVALNFRLGERDELRERGSCLEPDKLIYQPGVTFVTERNWWSK